MTDYSALLDLARIDILEDIRINPTCIKVGGNTWGTLSNFSAVIGKAKSKKSFLIMIALAAAVKQSEGLITVEFAKDKDKVLLFDTEQSKFHIQRAVKRISYLAGNIHPHNLETYGLRRHPPVTRLAMIEQCIYDNYDTGLVVIDGIRDLVTSINDEEQATMITSKLLKWTEERNIHIIIVLHQNKGDNNARGHVGSEIINKAETVISVSKDPDNKEISNVQVEYARDKEFEPFSFTIDENGMPAVVENFLKPEGKKAITPADVSKEMHGLILDQIFIFAPNFYYKEFIIQVKLNFQSKSIKIGDNKAKEFITYYMNQGWVEKVEGGKRYPYYKLK